MRRGAGERKRAAAVHRQHGLLCTFFFLLLPSLTNASPCMLKHARLQFYILVKSRSDRTFSSPMSL